MAAVAITNTFANNTVADASQVNTNFSDLVTYINNRNDATANWDRLSVLSSSAVPFIADNSTGTANIADFKDNGSIVFSVVDGGYCRFSNGTAALPSVSFINDTDSGAYTSAANNYDIATGGVQRVNISSTGLDIKQQLTVSGASRFRATRGTIQTIATATWTTIIYATETYDNLSEYNNATGVFTATVAGYYLVHASAISANVAWGASAEEWSLRTLMDGAIYGYGHPGFARAVATFVMMATLTDIIYMSAGSTLVIQIYHNRGSNTDIQALAEANRFMVHRIS